MKQSNIISGLDIGSYNIKAVVMELGEERPKIIGLSNVPSEGMRRGVVVNLEKTIEGITRALNEAQHMAGIDLDSVCVAVGGEHIRNINSKGIVYVSNSSGEITRSDISRAKEAASTLSLPKDRVVIHTIPQEFIVDKQPGIKDPRRMFGQTLEVEVHIITAAETAIRNINRAVEISGFSVEKFVFAPLASAEAVLTEDEKRLGTLLIDFGAGTTDLAVFYDGSIRYSGVVGYGGKAITNDIAIGLRTPLEQAEKLKLEYGCALSSMVKAEDMITVPGMGNRPPKEVSRSVLTAIIEPRVEEIFGLIKNVFYRTQFSKSIGSGIVITGGSAVMSGVAELCEQVFDMPAKIGVPYGFDGFSDTLEDPSNATVFGLSYFLDDEYLDFSGEESILERAIDSLRRIFRRGDR